MSRPTALARMLAAYQAAGIVWAVQFAEQMLPAVHTGFEQLMLGAYIGFVGLSAISGILLWRGHWMAFPVFALTQAVQVPDAVLGGYLYTLYAPARLMFGVGLDSGDIIMRFNVGAGYRVGHSSKYAAYVGVNVAPIVAVLIARWRASLAGAQVTDKERAVTTAA